MALLYEDISSIISFRKALWTKKENVWHVRWGRPGSAMVMCHLLPYKTQCTVYYQLIWKERAIVISVVSAQANVFAQKLNRIGKILRIFDKLDEIKS